MPSTPVDGIWATAHRAIYTHMHTYIGIHTYIYLQTHIQRSKFLGQALIAYKMSKTSKREDTHKGSFLSPCLYCQKNKNETKPNQNKKHRKKEEILSLCMTTLALVDLGGCLHKHHGCGSAGRDEKVYMYLWMVL